jgi:hypothetical protein
MYRDKNSFMRVVVVVSLTFRSSERHTYIKQAPCRFTRKKEQREMSKSEGTLFLMFAYTSMSFTFCRTILDNFFPAYAPCELKISKFKKEGVRGVAQLCTLVLMFDVRREVIYMQNMSLSLNNKQASKHFA